MARKTTTVAAAAIETIRHRLDLKFGEFSLALGLGESTYADMVRRNQVSQTVYLAAEALMRRQAPAAEAELAFVVRIVKGAALVTELAELRTIILDGARYLLLPAELPRAKPAPLRQAANGAGAPDAVERAAIGLSGG